jgi:hypothetical protein
MKKLLCISFFLLSNYFAKADQLAWLSKEQAEMTVQFFQEYGIDKAIYWCACCDDDIPKIISITNVFYRYTGTEEYYEVVIEGNDQNGTPISEPVDLAYVHIPSGPKANCLGKELGFECSPCTVPFLWPN